jgi:SPP1 gp7 family putative phage head morphogenesis protein
MPISTLEKQLLAEANRIAKAVHQGKMPAGSLDVVLSELVANHLYGGVEAGYGASLSNIDYTTPDAAMLLKLQQNVWHFSAAKNAHQIIELNALLIDPNGKMREWNDYKTVASKVSDKYLVQHLRTEYNHAVASAQMASQWQAFDDDAMLVYKTVGDANVRNAHATLHNIRRPKSDPFWDTYYPPNDWNCRCDVQATDSDHHTPTKDIETPTIPTLFKNNIAKKGMIYPPEHPYWALFDDGFRTQLKQYSKEAMDLEYETLIPIFNDGKGGIITAHWEAITANEYLQNIDIAMVLAKNGNKVELLPDITKAGERRNKWHSNSKSDKNPDAWVNGEITEFKKPVYKKNIRKNVFDASTQAENAVIILNDEWEFEPNQLINWIGTWKDAVIKDNKFTLKSLKFVYRGKLIE